MLLSKIKTTTQYKLTSAKKLPDNEVLSSFFMEAMYFVANKCAPNELLRQEDTDEPVLRNIEDGAYLVVPDEPDFASVTDHLMMDEDLTYACINYVCFLITNNPSFKQLTEEVINEFQANYGREYNEY